MRIEEKKSIFKPVIITLEKPRELIDLMEAIENTNSENIQPLKDWYDTEYGWTHDWAAEDDLPLPKTVSQKEEKYMVFKLEDVKVLAASSANFRHAMEEMVRYYYSYRDTHGKSTRNKYIVCNQDEPYAEKVWRVILEGEDKKCV